LISDKPKLLLIAGYFPPVRISTGSIRPWNLARYLIELGWEVTVVTPKISVWNPKHLDDVENKIAQINTSGIKMIYTNHSMRFLAPWRYQVPKNKMYYLLGGMFRVITRILGIQNWIGWVPSAINSCRKLRPKDVDIILATGAPFWGFTIAHQLSKRWNRPFVMDYRDLWTNSPWNPPEKKWVIYQEKNLLKKCSAITIVSRVSGEALSHKYEISNKLYTITNGYDPNDIQNVVEKYYDHFSIVFAGRLIPLKRTLSPILKALKYITDHSLAPNSWRFYYCGPNKDLAHEEILHWGLEEQSINLGELPRKEAISYIKGASLNVIIESNNENPTLEDRGVIPGKIYELIGLNANILSIVPIGSAVEEILADVGVKSYHPNDTENIVEFILRCMNGYKMELHNREKYSWEALSRQFDILLRNIIQIPDQV
jgi:hypothetical protein